MPNLLEYLGMVYTEGTEEAKEEKARAREDARSPGSNGIISQIINYVRKKIHPSPHTYNGIDTSDWGVKMAIHNSLRGRR